MNETSIEPANAVKVLTVVGTRPQLIKAAALQPELRIHHEEIVVDTGQHWDDNLAGVFFRELGLLRPDFSLDAGGGSHAQQVASILSAIDPILTSERPDVVLVFGDTNSTLAGALASAKRGVPVAHVEAGLRSFDRRMPEEINRIVVDHLSSSLFAPTPTAIANLAKEGIQDRVYLVGDLMQDLAARTLQAIRDPRVLEEIAQESGLSARGIRLEPGAFLYSTIHRQENREPEAMAKWVALLARAATRDRPVVLALHPGTRAALETRRIDLSEFVAVIEPLGYRSSLTLQLFSAAVLTDSGGIQREAAWLGTPCLVLRGSTEWAEALATAPGGMVLVGLDMETAMVALDRLAPPASSSRAAELRSSQSVIAEVGAAALISEALAR